MSPSLSRGKVLSTTGVGIDRQDLPPYEDGRLDPREWFDEPARRFEIEIGSGKGTFLVQQAPLAPMTNFLGIERAADFYRYAADRVRRRGLASVRLLHHDAVDFLRFWCADGVAAVIHLYFSDPWPKSRHHKRRVVQDRSLREFHRVLAPGGELRLVTDQPDLRHWYEEHADRHADRYVRRPFAAPESAGEGEIVGTNYERKFVREGRPFHGMILVRRETEGQKD